MNDLIQKLYESIAYFLEECKNNDWDLDSDDLGHVLAGDFDYIRKQHIINEVVSQ